MIPTNDAEETTREFATRFIDGSLAGAADLLTEGDREAVVESSSTRASTTTSKRAPRR